MEDFNFFVNVEIDDDILKSSTNTKKSGRYDNMVLQGRASTNTKDRQGETLEPSGYDISEFLKGGLINLEHYTTRKGSSKYWIGHPIDAKIQGDEFFIKAKLWKGRKEAEDLWDTLLIMKENNVDRQLGWSIEGSKKAVDPEDNKRVTKARINHVALTFSPVGYNTYADIVKSKQNNGLSELNLNGGEEKGGIYLLQFEKDGRIVTVNTDFSIKITEKAMDTESLKPLIRESLKKKTTNNVTWDNIVKAIKEGKISANSVPLVVSKYLTLE